MNRLSLALADGAIVAKRNLIKIKRVPDILVFTLMSPIMFVLLFAYVFGGSIDVPGGVNYREFLLAGIFVQTVIFGSTFSGAGMADDMQKGIIDRFRSLPMSPAAVLVGRTASDIVNNVLSLGVMSLTGLVVGWQPDGFLLSAWPEPELHKVLVPPHDQDGYWWMTVDETERWLAPYLAYEPADIMPGTST